MTITGIDSTGQSAGGNVLPPNHEADADDLDAELLALETEVATAPISVIPAVDAAAESEPEAARAPVGGALSPGETFSLWRPSLR